LETLKVIYELNNLWEKYKRRIGNVGMWKRINNDIVGKERRRNLLRKEISIIVKLVKKLYKLKK